jgi:uncharacterized protein YjbJ (UPF0337 family)
MNKNEIEGTLRETAGRVEEALGSLSNDTKRQLRGKAEEIAGEVQATAGDAIDSVRDFASSKPIGTVLLAAGTAFLLGMFWAKTRHTS